MPSSFFFCPTPDATSDLAAKLAVHLTSGDAIMLHGDVGAGKSHFARSLIRARLPEKNKAEDIPSPTFTLVQTYQSANNTTIWHADLYRLGGSDEVEELGLSQAFGDAITLIEWPEKLGDQMPDRRLDITLSQSRMHVDARCIEIAPFGSNWDWVQALEEVRTPLRQHFMQNAGWNQAEQIKIAGDASNRAYTRLALNGQTAILMDAPSSRNEDTRPFVAVGQYLRTRGYSAPEILAQDTSSGLLLLEDLGDDLFASVIQKQPGLEPVLYADAVDLLVDLQSEPALPELPLYSDAIYHRESALLLDWYLKRPDLSMAFRDALDAVLAKLTKGPLVTILRDYHAENLLWLPARTGSRKIGLLDFQDALRGHPAYDLVSLLEDARRDVTPELATAMKQRFAAKTGASPAEVAADCAILGAQRNAKILGLFTRLAVQAGKQHYLDLIPRVHSHFLHDLEHPALSEMREVLADALPEKAQK